MTTQRPDIERRAMSRELGPGLATTLGGLIEAIDEILDIEEDERATAKLRTQYSVAVNLLYRIDYRVH